MLRMICAGLGLSAGEESWADPGLEDGAFAVVELQPRRSVLSYGCES